MKEIKQIIATILLLGVSLPVSAAHLYFYPNDIELTSGQKATVELRIDTGSQKINAGEISGTLIGDAVRISSIESTNSVFRLFIEAGNNADSFTLIGGAPGGFSGAGVIARLALEARENGSSTLQLDSKSKILIHDGAGTAAEVVRSVAYISVESRPENYILITSKSHPDESRWYNAKDLLLHWDVVSGVDYSYEFGQEINAVPDDLPDHPEGKLLFLGDVRIADLPDGVYYFALKQVGADIVSRFKVMQDRELPRFEQVTMSSGGIETGGKPALVFFASDELSGIDHYEVSFDGAAFEEVSSPLVIGRTYKYMRLRAYDRAGNFIEKDIYPKLSLIDLMLLLLILLLILILLYILHREHKKHIQEDRERAKSGKQK